VETRVNEFELIKKNEKKYGIQIFTAL